MDAGEVSISAAAEVATLPADEQDKIVAAGPEAVKAKASEIRTDRAATAIATIVTPTIAR